MLQLVEDFLPAYVTGVIRSVMDVKLEQAVLQLLFREALSAGQAYSSGWPEIEEKNNFNYINHKFGKRFLKNGLKRF